jgi:hypothetical protein
MFSSSHFQAGALPVCDEGSLANPCYQPLRGRVWDFKSLRARSASAWRSRTARRIRAPDAPLSFGLITRRPVMGSRDTHSGKSNFAGAAATAACRRFNRFGKVVRSAARCERSIAAQRTNWSNDFVRFCGHVIHTQTCQRISKSPECGLTPGGRPRFLASNRTPRTVKDTAPSYCTLRLSGKAAVAAGRLRRPPVTHSGPQASYSPLMPLALMIGHHFSISAF